MTTPETSANRITRADSRRVREEEREWKRPNPKGMTLLEAWRAHGKARREREQNEQTG